MKLLGTARDNDVTGNRGFSVIQWGTLTIFVVVNLTNIFGGSLKL